MVVFVALLVKSDLFQVNHLIHQALTLHHLPRTVAASEQSFGSMDSQCQLWKRVARDLLLWSSFSCQHLSVHTCCQNMAKESARTMYRFDFFPVQHGKHQHNHKRSRHHHSASCSFSDEASRNRSHTTHYPDSLRPNVSLKFFLKNRRHS